MDNLIPERIFHYPYYHRIDSVYIHYSTICTVEVYTFAYTIEMIKTKRDIMILSRQPQNDGIQKAENADPPICLDIVI